jgi:hypothetical protein
MEEKRSVKKTSKAIKAIQADLKGLLSEFEAIRDADKGEFEVEEVATLLEELRKLMGLTGAMDICLVSAIERDRGKEDFIPLPKGGAMEAIYTGGGRKWRHDRVKSDLAGEFEEAYQNKDGTVKVPVGQLVREAFDCAGIGYWKVSGLERFELDPDAYSTKNPRKFKLKIHRD